MKIEITGKAKEIVALVLAVQGRQVVPAQAGDFRKTIKKAINQAVLESGGQDRIRFL